MRRQSLVPLLAAVAALTATPAAAQDVQNFKPAQGTWNYFSVEGARVAPHGLFVPQLYVNYASQPLVERDANDEVVSKLVEHMVTTNFMVTVGIFDHFEIGVDVPLHYVDGDAVEAGFALGDIRLMPKARLYGLQDGEDGFGVALAVPMNLPTGDNEKFVGGDQFTLNPKLVLEAKVAIFRLAVNGGVRVRPETKAIDSLELGNEVTYGAGIGLTAVPSTLEFLAEVWGAAPLEDINDDSRSAPLEALLGLRVFTPPGIVLNAAGGLGIIPDYGSPVYRVLFGIGYHDLETDRDGDGILDEDDACPDDPEDKDEFQDVDGCPDPDNDEDGILDVVDECPLNAEDKDGFEDTDGCPDPDNDKDGILDVNDQCPNDAETFNDYQDVDGCPDGIPDTDGDGLLDPDDKCPNDPEDKDGFQDEDGCPDPDNDKDGILDVNDKCPNDPETVNGHEDDDGCPDEAEVRVRVTKEKIEILEKVFFELNKDIIKPVSFPVLDDVARVLVANPAIKKVRVEGHTDSQGSDRYNLQLSQRRADSVKRYLIGKGVPAERLEAVGYGESRPIETNATREGRAINRRVEFTILEREGQ
jgi:outer membrane protein OmpA-like peptidoglycan-associated protein